MLTSLAEATEGHRRHLSESFSSKDHWGSHRASLCPAKERLTAIVYELRRVQCWRTTSFKAGGCGMDAGEGKPTGQLLGIDEVRAVGLPAQFSAYGDHLVYVDGTIYALPRELDPCDLADLPSLSGVYAVSHVVGIEYGWQHIEACAPAAANEVPQQAA